MLVSLKQLIYYQIPSKYEICSDHCINIIFPNSAKLKGNKRLKTEEDTKVFLDYMVKVSENVKVPKMKEFINEINHEIEIDSERGKYYKSCKGILTIPA